MDRRPILSQVTAVTDYSQRVPAVERAMGLLETLAGSPQGLATAEILEEVGGSRSGLYALLNTLKARGYVVSDDGRHRLGPAVRGLVPDRPRDMATLVEALPHEVRSQPLTETVALVWPHHGRGVVVAEEPGERAVRVSYGNGSTRPDDAPDSLVIAAGAGGDDAALGHVRQRGTAMRSTSELTEVAAPVCRDGIRPIAALVTGVPAQRAGDRQMEEVERGLRQVAARLSHRLGAPVYQPYGWSGSEPVGPSRDLDRDELDIFLAGQWGAQLACVRSDGTPHVVPLWYEWDGDSVWLAASPGASWRSNVAENPAVSITLDEPWPPLRRAFLAGRVVEVPDRSVPDGIEGLRRRLATRYLGRGADTEPGLSEIDGWAVFQLVPDRVHGRQGLGAGP